MDGIKITGRRSIRVRELLVCCFTVWPFFWCLWYSQRIPQALLGEHFSVFLMFVLALVSCLAAPVKVKKPMTFWLLFYLVTLLEIRKARLTMYGQDIGISMSSWLICASVGQTDYDRDRIIRCIRAIGFLVAVSVLLERALHLFSGVLGSLYTVGALNSVKGARGFGGGVLPLSSYAGCFIVPGLGAMVIMERESRKKRGYYFGLVIYILSMIFLRKRGFIVDIILTAFFLRYLELRSQGKIILRKNKSFMRLAAAVGLLLLLFAVYLFVPTVHEALDSLLLKFYEEDGDFSGRDKLYALALSIFLANPLTGIGWAKYREFTLGIYSAWSTKTYEVHNVYLQLLCENGVLGLLAFLLATGQVLLFSTRKYLQLSSGGEAEGYRCAVVRLSIFIQVFFLTYCITGNPLYDYPHAVTYFIGVLLAFI